MNDRPLMLGVEETMFRGGLTTEIDMGKYKDGLDWSGCVCWVLLHSCYYLDSRVLGLTECHIFSNKNNH